MFKEKAKAAVLALLFCVLPGCVAPEPTNTDIEIIDNVVVVEEGSDNKVIIEDEVVDDVAEEVIDEVVDNTEEVEPTIENPTVVEKSVKEKVNDTLSPEITIWGAVAVFVGLVFLWRVLIYLGNRLRG